MPSTVPKRPRERGADRRLVACVAAYLGLWVAASPVLLPTLARAGEYDGVRFADRITVAEHSLALRGLGDVVYLRLFRLYVGGLYLPDSVESDEALGPVPKRLELAYLRRITAAQFVEAGTVFLRRNLDAAQLDRLRDRIDAIHALYRDVDEGDRYALTYVPGSGTELSLNGKPLGRIEGDDFAAAYFAIWLGEDPVSRSFRRALLEPDAGV